MNLIRIAITIGIAWAAMLTASAADAPVDPSLLLAEPQSNYLLGCGGCHGVEGHSNARRVPDLRDQVGYFLSTQAGRDRKSTRLNSSHPVSSRMPSSA